LRNERRRGARDRETAVWSAFGPLSRYIFGRDREGEKIAMTVNRRSCLAAPFDARIFSTF